MRKEYNKLVRDRIPDIIRQDGRKCQAMTIPEREYRQALLEKLIEEAQETAAASPQEMVAELADLYEVIDTIMAVYEIDRESVLQEQERKRTERGSFEQRIRLLSTD
jgi:predicted house-cleaning noncanonical NTP pyrophosphatase (MazG superfamily)